ncbi:MAG: bifunctional precorrin-2 dehydrogenase/sirohydrochlorin ferrochelatase [Nitrospirae bacterium]|nr:bifunctional precorrin-2 dehydrogenase/sirohydrochlorin ferrochelatase [Nitrospirota bacterium]
MTSVYYPAFLNLNKKLCIVIGGGRVAERKALSLIRSGARVKVISPVITGVLERERIKGNLTHIKRDYRRGDLKGAFLVIAATTDAGVNQMAAADAERLVNVADAPEIANFIAPAVVKRGLLTIAVSTSGASPAMAAAIKKEVERLYSKEFGEFLNYLSRLRNQVIKKIPDSGLRRRFLKDAGSEAVVKLIRNEGAKKARQITQERLNSIMGSKLK